MKIPKSPSLGYYFSRAFLILAFLCFFGIDLILIFHFFLAKQKKRSPNYEKNDMISHELPQQQIQSILYEITQKKNKRKKYLK